MEHVEIILRETGAQATLVKDGLRDTRPTSVNSILKSMNLLGIQDTGDLAFGVRRVKKVSGTTYVVLQCPARIRRITAFNNESLVPVPEHLMLFSFIERGSLYVHQNSAMVALASKDLLPQTRVYEFPFSNVTSTWICWGGNHDSVALPRNLNSGLEDLVSILWTSDFNNHLAAGKLPVEINGHQVNSMESLFERLHNCPEFPVTALRPIFTGDTGQRGILTYADWLDHHGLIL